MTFGGSIRNFEGGERDLRLLAGGAPSTLAERERDLGMHEEWR